MIHLIFDVNEVQTKVEIHPLLVHCSLRIRNACLKRVFSTQTYCSKRKRFGINQEFNFRCHFFCCFGTPKWPSRRHMKTLYIFFIHIIIVCIFLLFTDLDPCIDVLCDYHGLCKAFGPYDARCVCIDSCPQYQEPVCSSNGTTYDNTCLFKQEMCLLQLNYTVQHPGSCEGIRLLNSYSWSLNPVEGGYFLKRKRGTFSSFRYIKG